MKTLGIIALLTLPVIAFAQTAATPTPVPLTISAIQTLLLNILNVLYVFFFILAAICIILAVYLPMFRGEEGWEQAKKWLLYAVVAIAVALVATGVHSAVESLLRGQGIPTP